MNGTCDLCKKQSDNLVIYNEIVVQVGVAPVVDQSVKVCPKCNSRKKKIVLHQVSKALFEMKRKQK
jgi:hypothetical protein